MAAGEFITLTKLTIYVGEDIFYNDKQMYKAILEEAQKLKIAGASVYKCVGGYGTRIRGKEQRFMINFSNPINLPISMELIDTRERIELLYPFLKANFKHGVATVQDVNVLVTDYIKEKIEAVNRDQKIPAARF